jgi:hypothetical protein
MTADLGAPRCYWCGGVIAVQESGEWGHTLVGYHRLRFWCFGGNRVKPCPNDGARAC